MWSLTAIKIVVFLLPVLGLFVSSAHGLSGIRHYETLSYNPTYLQQQYNDLRDKRSLSTSLRLQINAYNRTFAADLSPNNQVDLFAPGVKFMMGNDEPVPYDPLTFYHGVLVDDDKSSVKGHVINGVFDGIIHSHGEEYHIEKAHKFFSTDQDFHSIIYRANDVEEPASICGIRDKVYEELHRLQSTGGRPSQRDRVMYGHIKRQTFQPRQFCPVLVAADHLFQRDVGGGDPAATTSEIVTVMGEVQEIYANTDFGIGYTVQPTIGRIQLLDETVPGYRFGAANINVNTFLDLWSQDDHSQFCLALLLTNRDFDDGVLGLAWLAEPTGGNRGGICEQSPVRLKTGLRYLNTAIVTFINFGRQQPRSVSVVTIAHQFGHSFGSPHDPLSGLCAPGGSAGNFIMFHSATDGQLTNNRMFSTCSLDSIRPVLQTKSACFVSDQFFCGNGVQEQGEECDCGSPSECASDPCCNSNCTLTPGSHCSPSNTNPCCTETCWFQSTDVICSSETECVFAVNCTGTMGTCGQPVPKDDSVTCNNGMNMCHDGVCSGSICPVVGLLNYRSRDLPIIGGVIGSVAFISAIAAVMVVIVCAKHGLTLHCFRSNRKSINYDTDYYDRSLFPPINTTSQTLDMHTNDAYKISSATRNTLPCNIESAINDTMEERMKMQENEAYQPTTDLHLVHNPAYGTNAANAPEVLTSENVAYERIGPGSTVTTRMVGLSRFQEQDSAEVEVQEIAMVEESGAYAVVV